MKRVLASSTLPDKLQRGMALLRTAEPVSGYFSLSEYLFWRNFCAHSPLRKKIIGKLKEIQLPSFVQADMNKPQGRASISGYNFRTNVNAPGSETLIRGYIH